MNTASHMKLPIFMIAMSLACAACAQTTAVNQSKTEDSKTNITMDLAKITNEKVKEALDALQKNDKTAWYSYFTEDTQFTDDGRTMNFKSFFNNAFDKKEKFLTIDKIENGGKDIYGNFYAGQWGTFRVYFKFFQNPEGKFYRLEIGQAAK